MAIVKRLDEFKEIVPKETGIKGVKMKVLSPEDRPFIVRLFSIEPDGNTPHHAHPWEHQVIILSGKGKVLVADKSFEVEKGFYLFIPPNEPHQFINTGNEPLEFICVIPKGE